MNLKKLFAALLALCMILCLCACGDADDKTPDENNPPQSDNTQKDPEPSNEGSKDDEPENEEPEVKGIVYTITVTDEGGNPVSGAMLQMCQGEICLLPASTDENGVVTFTVTEDGAYEAKFLSLPAGYEYVDDVQVFPFNGATELTIVLKAVA